MYNLFYIIFLIVFLQGIIHMNLNPAIAKWMFEPLVVVLFFFGLNSSPKRIPFLLPFLLFFSVFLVSVIHYKDYNQEAFTFFKPFIYSFMVFYTSFKSNFSHNELIKLYNLIGLLILIQLPTAVIKVISKGGFAEKWVGTMSYSGGSLHLIFPMLVISYLLGLYFFYNKDKKYIYLIIGFFIFGVTGAKKGVPFYLLGLIALGFLLKFHIYDKKSINFAKIISFSAAGLIAFYLSVVLIPGLNKEKEIGGSFDLEWLQDKVYSYSFYDDEKEIYQGRFGGTKVLVEDFFGKTKNYLSKKSLSSSLIGYKPSSFDESSYLTGNENVNEEHNRIIPTGFFRMLFALGSLGVIAFIFFYGAVFNFCRKLFVDKFAYFTPFGKALVFGSFLFSISIFVDFFTYTHMYTYNTIYFTYFFILGQIFRYRKNNRIIFNPLPDVK